MERLLGHSFNSRVYKIYLSLLFIFSVIPFSVSAAGTSSGTWSAPEEMPSWSVTAAIVILVAVYGLIVFELVHRALAAALGGVAAVVALHIASGSNKGPDLSAVMTWIDWETIGLLIGMMVMVDILSKTGLFEWAAVQAYAQSGGSIWRLTFILCIITAFFSALLDNVTTILLIVPVTIQICKVLDLEPVPLIIAEVMFSNIGGAATQIGDPPNIIIGAQLSSQSLSGTSLASQSIGFSDFIIHVAPAVLIAIIPAFWLLRIIEKPGLSGNRVRNVDLLRLQYMGLIEMIAELISDTVSKASEANRLMVAVLLLLWVSAIASAFIDNIPYTATMVPVVIELASDETLGLELGPLAWALALGACLGGNGTIIGASANVVAAGLAEESGNDISFNRFFRTGFPIMILTLLLATVYCVVRYAIEWSNDIIPMLIITVLIIGSLSLTPLVYKDLENIDIKDLDFESE